MAGPGPRPTPLLAVRTSSSVELQYCSPECFTSCDDFSKYHDGPSRLCVFSSDGKLLAWHDTKGHVNVISLPECELLMQVLLPKTSFVAFSPLSTLLVTWEPYAVNKDNPSHANNLRLWDVKTGKVVKEFNQKKQSTWLPQWTDDEFLCARNVSNEVHFFENNNFDTIVKKIYIQKVACFELSRGPAPYHILCYVPGTSGQPSFIRLYCYPNVEGTTAAIANKSFFRADKVDMKWNSKGTCVLVIATSDVDKTDSSYYGEQKLHFFDTKGESGMVQLAKGGPVYSVEWNPNGTEYCVVYGYMPAKATLFNLKGEAVFDFGTGPRNVAYYNPQGHLLILAGFGNLRGHIEVWNMKRRQQLSKFLAADTTYLEWGPNGEHFITATTSPRLRVGNNYKLWYYTGEGLSEVPMAAEQFLYEVKWQPFPAGVFGKRDLPSAQTAAVVKEAPKLEVYRPPGARGQASSFKLHEYEKASNAQQDLASKNALKNKKKRDAKKAKKDTEPNVQPVTEPVANVPDILEDIDDLVFTSTGDDERDKKIKNVQKKLTQIKKLKTEQSSGKQLEINQLEKIKKEQELVVELRQLQIR